MTPFGKVSVLRPSVPAALVSFRGIAVTLVDVARRAVAQAAKPTPFTARVVESEAAE